MFHGFGMTNQPVWCSERNVLRFSSILTGRSRRQRGGDNASNPHAIAINPVLLSDAGGLRCAKAAINTRAASIFRPRVVIGMTCHLLFAAAIRYAIADTYCHGAPPRFR